MKRNLIISISIVIVLIIAILIYFGITQNSNTQVNNNISSTQGIKTTVSLENNIEENTIWCGTFQLIWNDLKNDLAKQDIVFTPQEKIVENLNKETFTTEDISEKSYYKKYGIANLELKAEIEKAIKEKFNETSDILDDFDFENTGEKDYFLYSMLRKNFEFEKEFEELDQGDFGRYKNVNYFGIESSESEELREQVEVLYYKSKDDFAIKLKTKQEDEVVLCKNPEGKTFNEIYYNIIEKNDNYDGDSSLAEGEQLKIPNIKLKEKTEIKEVENRAFSFSNGDNYAITKALQTIEFELDRKGGKIKSEAGIMTKELAMQRTREKREFFIDNTFAIFLVENGKDKPYFAGKISNITKFQ